MRFYAEEARRGYGEVIPGNRSSRRLFALRQPVGVIAAITPWNFPALMIARKVAPALAAGCGVVLKPASEAPLSGLALAELGARAGLPAGILNVVHGEPEAVGAVLTSDETVRMLTFTGSTEVGKLLMAQCAGTVKRMALELGGNSPFIVFDDADIGAAVQGAIDSKFRNAGQTCVCANRILVQSGIHDAFVERFSEAVNQLKVGHGLDAEVAIGPLIEETAVAKVERHLSDATSKGAHVLSGGQRHRARGHVLRADHPRRGHIRDGTGQWGDVRAGGAVLPVRDGGRGLGPGQLHLVGAGRLLLHQRPGASLPGR